MKKKENTNVQNENNTFKQVKQELIFVQNELEYGMFHREERR